MRLQTPQPTNAPTSKAPSSQNSQSATAHQRSRRADTKADDETSQPAPASSTSSQHRTNVTITRTVTTPVANGMQTETVTCSFSTPTRLPSPHIVVDVDDFDSDDDCSCNGSSDFYTPPATPTPSRSAPSIGHPTPVLATPATPSRQRSSCQTPSRQTPSRQDPTGPAAPLPPRAPLPPLIIHPSSVIRSTRIPDYNRRTSALANARQRRAAEHDFPPPQFFNARVPSPSLGLHPSGPGRRVIKEYLPRHPDTLVDPGFYSKKWFILIGGQDSGLYPKWTTILGLTEGTICVSEGRKTFSLAKKVYEWAYKNRFIFVLPVPGGGYENRPFIQRELPPDLDDIPMIHTWPTPAEIEASLPDDAEKYYVVIVGEEPGVWTSWLEAGPRVVRVRADSKLITLYDKQSAVDAYRDAHGRHIIRAIPIVGGIFDKRLTLPPYPRA